MNESPPRLWCVAKKAAGNTAERKRATTFRQASVELQEQVLHGRLHRDAIERVRLNLWVQEKALCNSLDQVHHIIWRIHPG